MYTHTYIFCHNDKCNTEDDSLASAVARSKYPTGLLSTIFSMHQKY